MSRDAILAERQAGDSWTVFRHELGCELAKAWRTPSFIVPTLLMPVCFYSLFALGMPSMAGVRSATYLLATYVVFGSMAPGLFGAGTVLAAERAGGWIDLQRAAPMRPGMFIASKLMAATIIGLVSTAGVMVAAGVFGPVRLAWWRWVMLLLVAAGSALPFALLGLVIGLLARPGSAAAWANLLFLPMAFLSGLWFPLQALYDGLQNVGWALPAFHLAQFSFMAVGLVTAPELFLLHLVILFGWVVFSSVLVSKTLASWTR